MPELSNSLDKNQQRIQLLEKERELDEKSIALLRQDQQLKETQLQQRNILIAVLMLAMALMALAGFYIIRSSKEKKRANQWLALKSLRSQMNPHFIFNALNSVNHYISQNDERQANKYLSDFSRLMRSVMQNSQYDFIPLNDEIDLLQLYLQLEHSRFRDKFEYVFNIEENMDFSLFEVPPMLIQPYIENAVWHGLRYLDKKGSLNISISQPEKNKAKISIQDNGIGRRRSQELKTKNQLKQQSTGMKNIDHRLKLMNELFKTNISVSITDLDEEKEDAGTRVEIVISDHKIS